MFWCRMRSAWDVRFDSTSKSSSRADSIRYSIDPHNVKFRYGFRCNKAVLVLAFCRLIFIPSVLKQQYLYSKNLLNNSSVWKYSSRMPASSFLWWCNIVMFTYFSAVYCDIFWKIFSVYVLLWRILRGRTCGWSIERSMSDEAGFKFRV